MMGERRGMQEALFHSLSLERHVPDDHLLRQIDRFVDLLEIWAHLGPYYSDFGRPSIDPELMIRMLIVGYGFRIRSERRLCEEVHLNLAVRSFSTHPVRRRCRALSTQRSLNPSERFPPGQPAYLCHTTSRQMPNCRNQRCGLIRPSPPSGRSFPPGRRNSGFRLCVPS